MRRRILFVILLLVSCTISLRSQIKVACVGNSITYGVGVNDRLTESYPAVLQQLLGANYAVGNFGLSGATLLTKGHNPYVKTTQYSDALAMKPDIVVIHLGINDTDPRNYPIYSEEFQSDYTALIQSFRDGNPGVRIIIARLTPISESHFRFKAGTRVWYNKIQSEIERIAKVTQVELVDFQELLYSRQNLIPDAVHPNAKGASLLAHRVNSAITGDFGGLSLSPLYTDNMVLQCGDSTRLRGVANASDLVNVRLHNAQRSITAQARTDRNGRWSVRLDLRDYGNYSLEISTADSSVNLKNVAVGQVWLLSGQSNMSMPVSQSATPKTALPSDNIRLFKANPAFPIQDSLSAQELERLNNLDYLRDEGWDVASAEAVADFSAVGYYFARELTTKLKGVKIGLIQTSLGGAGAEGFVSRRAMENDDLLVDMYRNYRTNPMIMDWCRQVMARSLKGSKEKPQRHYFEPSYLYESRVEPLAGYTIKGVLWYQGESNAENVELHERLFPAVVNSFREAFDNDALLFYFVQLSSLNRPSWCRFRDSQRRMAQTIENCEMVVSSDYGNPTDVHPRVKDVIGRRLANVALARDYQFSDIEYRSPVAVQFVGSEIVFQCAGKGLLTSDSQPVRGFETASDDMIFRATEAIIVKNKIILKTTNPKYVRYGWQPYTDANLVGSSLLPISTFEGEFVTKTAVSTKKH